MDAHTRHTVSEARKLVKSHMRFTRTLLVKLSELDDLLAAHDTPDHDPAKPREAQHARQETRRHVRA